MSKDSFCQLWLSCNDQQEASKIATKLLKERLITCAKQIPVVSAYRWKGKIEHESEILLLMESRMDLFDEVEREISQLHSYDTFLLEATLFGELSQKAESWMEKELK